MASIMITSGLMWMILWLAVWLRGLTVKHDQLQNVGIMGLMFGVLYLFSVTIGFLVGS